MKRILGIVVAVVFVVGCAGVLFAEEGKKANNPMMQKGMQGKKMMGMCPMHGMMMKREVVATQDGGIVILMGNKLVKYDKDLNLVKEAEVAIDTEAMCKSMAEMKEKCAMCSEMKQNCPMMPGQKEGREPKEGAIEPAK